MKYQSRITLSREGWYYLTVWVFILSGASMRQINLLMVIAGMMLGPLLINLITVLRSLRAVEVSRSCARQITASQPLSVEICLEQLSKPRRWFWFRPRASRVVMVEDTIRRIAPASEQGEYTPRVLFASIAAGQRETLHYTGRIRERGHYQLGPLKISTTWPFGLFTKTVTVADRRELIVYARPGKLTTRWYQVMREADAGTHYMRGRLGQQEGDFYGLRDWREGDSQRWIHWRTSARRGSLLVRQFEQSRSQDLILLVDVWQPYDATQRDSFNVEQAIEFASTIVGNVCARGTGHLAVATFGTQVERFDGPASTLLLADLLSHFAQLAPGDSAAPESDHNTRLESLIQNGLRGVTRRRNVVLLSTRPIDREQLLQASPSHDPEILSALARCLCLSTDGDAAHVYFESDQNLVGTDSKSTGAIVQAESKS